MQASFTTHSQPTPRLTLSLVCPSVLQFYSSVDNMKSPKPKWYYLAVASVRHALCPGRKVHYDCS